MKAVEIENLSKTYQGGITAVDAISLTLEQGEIFGFLGPNGAGKTTAVKVLNGMLAPTTGSCRVLGIDPSQSPEEVLARAMIHQPQVLFLDEPTSGLDPESAQSVNFMIRELAQDTGTTIFLCTHQLRYAQEICTSYGLINEGILLASGNLQQLRSMVQSGMTVKMKASGIPSGLQHRRTGAQDFEMDVLSEEEIPAIVKQIVEAGNKVYHVSMQPPSLEDIYFSLIEKQKGGRK